MKATGIVRRIDDLGRVVIPKEIRRTLRIREGDPLEIFTDREGEIILKKYSPIGELGGFAKEYAETLSQVAGHTVLIVDRDQIISVAGGSKKEFLDRRVSDAFEKMLYQRNLYTSAKAESNFISILDNDDDPSYTYILAVPIIVDGDVIGAVVLLSSSQKMGDIEVKLSTCAAGFLGKHMEN